MIAKNNKATNDILCLLKKSGLPMKKKVENMSRAQRKKYRAIERQRFSFMTTKLIQWNFDAVQKTISKSNP